MTEVCAVVGIGPGNGRALTQRFARAGQTVAMLSRNADYLHELANEVDGAVAFPCDATDEKAVHATFERIHRELGPVSTVIYNAGAGIFKNAEEAGASDFEATWKTNTLGLVHVAQATLPQLRSRTPARLIVMGASAAWRGRAQTAPFASAKAAQHSLAQSLARQLGPEHIHVAYVVIDGVIDLPRTREMLPDQPDEFFLNPDAIADSVWALCQQDPSAWTFELDLRPFGEAW